MLSFIMTLCNSQLNDRGGKQTGERGENKLCRLSKGLESRKLHEKNRKNKFDLNQNLWYIIKLIHRILVLNAT